MANVQKFYTLDTGVANNYFSGIWMLTRCMKQAGWLYKASSDGNATTDTSGVAANDLWGGNATPTNDTYPTAFSSRNGPWWVASGPNVIKIGITVASTGTFVRGESVTQATSAATGELLGYVFDATNNGWIIIMPRTGTFDGTHVITGGISAATATATSVKKYTQEVCIWKNAANGINGTVYWIMADASAESTSLFSNLAVSTPATATVAPGGNADFPASAIAILGTGNTNTSSTWFGNQTATAHVLVAAANATPGAGVSADGTSWIMQSTTSGTPATSNLAGIFRLDDTEPGDVCPFEWQWIQSTAASSYSRTVGTGQNQTGTSWSVFNETFTVVFNGYIARGVGGSPGTIPDVASYHKSSFPGVSTSGGQSIFVNNNADVVRAQNHPATIKPLGVDTVSIWNDKTNVKQSKGRLRWMRYASVGNVFDTTDSKLWVCWLSVGTNISPAVYIGPWDGSTTPTQ